MRKPIAAFFLMPCAAVAFSAAQLAAGVIPPSGLTPGTQYQLIFVTLGTTAATRSDIDYYNSFVANEAASGIPFGLP